MSTDVTPAASTIALIPIKSIGPSPLNPRKHFDETKLNELADSIRRHGIRSPLNVRPRPQGTFEIIAGERRYRASQLADLALLPCLVTPCTDEELVELALTENGQRDDLTPMDEARSYQAAMDANPKHYTVSVIAAAVGKSESHVYRRLKLLELVAPLQEALDENRLSIAHAERLVKLTPAQQADAADLKRGKFDGGGVVWRSSPLLTRDDKDWKPGLEDLQPLHELDWFIRNKTAFNPAAGDLRYLQPELATAIDEAVADHAVQVESDDVEEARASIVAITNDPMVRSRMGVKATDAIPLTPSKWRAVKPGKPCDAMRPGVHTQGPDAGTVVTVCTKRSCKVHWPVAKKAKKATTPKAPARDWEAEQRERDAQWQREQEAWQQTLAEVCPLLAAHTADVAFSAHLVRATLGTHAIAEVERCFGVVLTDATAAHVLLLREFTSADHYRPSFVEEIKRLAPTFLPTFNQIERTQKKAAAKVAQAAAKKAKAPAAKKASAARGKKAVA
jgi:ParB family transcriptional regulator, chromosome partitioning protein